MAGESYDEAVRYEPASRLLVSWTISLCPIPVQAQNGALDRNSKSGLIVGRRVDLDLGRFCAAVRHIDDLFYQPLSLVVTPTLRGSRYSTTAGVLAVF